MAKGEIDLTINIRNTSEKVKFDSDYIIRRKAVDLNIPLFTIVQITKKFVKGLKHYHPTELKMKRWDEFE